MRGTRSNVRPLGAIQRMLLRIAVCQKTVTGRFSDYEIIIKRPSRNDRFYMD